VAKEKSSIRILLKSEKAFAFPGLWDKWRDVEGEKIRSFTILTGPPNALIKAVHHRMPVILGWEDQAARLDPTVPLNAIERIRGPYPADAMRYYAVSKYVNAPRNDTPDCIAPLNRTATSQKFGMA